MSFLITELNIRRCRIKGRRCPRKRVQGWSRFAFGCHEQLTQEREIEGERERQSEKHQQDNISEYKELNVHMHENA